MLEIFYTNRFIKSLNLCKKRKYDTELLKKVANYLIEEKPLPKKYRAHKLSPQSLNMWDCHIEDDWILLFRVDYKNGKVIFEDTGTHSDLFETTINTL